MKSQFITNQSKLLSEVFKNIIPSSENLYFLVGYFYFSGFEEIQNEVQDKKMKILVGMEVEKVLSDKIKEYEILQDINYSRGEVKENYTNSMVNIINDTNYFDNDNKKKAFKFFLEKLKDGSLEIRKTLQSNHSKLYLFENKLEFSQGGEYVGTLITGSSNLSISGLKHRHEINVVFRDQHYTEGKKLFDELWESSVEIVDKNNLEDFMKSVVDRTWMKDTLPKPYMMFVRVLAEYFAVDESIRIKSPEEITSGKFINLKYQTDAIRHAIRIGLAKIIRSVSEKNLEQDMKNMIEEIPHNYIIEIISKAKQIEEGEESLILSEELI